MTPDEFDVCVVGAGPAGLGFAQEWSRTNPTGRLLLVEAGPLAEERFCTVQNSKGCRKVEPCHVISGIGGASGLAGGKISEYPAGRGLSIIMGDSVERELQRSMDHLERHVPMVRPETDDTQLERESRRYRDLNYELRHYPANKYAQTDLKSAWSDITRDVVSAGGTVLTHTRVTAIEKNESGLDVTVHNEAGDRLVRSRSVVIATGRSGGDLASAHGTVHQQHALDIGIRIEFPATCWPDLDAVHNDLKLHFGDARTFCTSKSGWISPYKFRDFMLLEGRTDVAAQSQWSNLAITIRTDSPAEEIMTRMRNALLAQGPGSSLRQPLGAYLEATPTPKETNREPHASFSYWRWGDINSLFTDDLAQRLRDAVRDFSSNILPPSAAANAYVFGPEIDYYWPTMPHRSAMSGVWAAGDVTGSYRGILQAYTAGRYLVAEVDDYLSTQPSQLGRLPKVVTN